MQSHLIATKTRKTGRGQSTGESGRGEVQHGESAHILSTYPKMCTYMYSHVQLYQYGFSQSRELFKGEISSASTWWSSAWATCVVRVLHLDAVHAPVTTTQFKQVQYRNIHAWNRTG